MEKYTKIKTILVAVDFTEKANNAVTLAVQMAKRHHARIILFHNFNNFFIVDRTGRQTIGNQDISQAEESLIKLKTLLQQKYAEIEFLVGMGNDTLINSLNQMIEAESVDLVIAGTSGKQGIRELFLGSSSYQILTGINCSVLMMPEDFHRYNFEKILVPVRVSEQLEEKVDLSMLIAERNNGTISLLGISDEQDLEKMQQAYLSVRETLKESNTEYYASFIVTEDKATEISKVSKDEEFDLIILNDTDEKIWKSFFSENFLKQIINNTSVPLLFFKDRNDTPINPENVGYDITLPSPG